MLINTSLQDAGLVGRKAELAVLDRVLSRAADAPHVTYLHGPGGIGKSSLLRHTARQARFAGREVVHVDARFLNADPRRLEEAAAPACVEPGAVLLIDNFERCRQVEPWLRDTFLPRLEGGATVVLASRTAPDAEWSLDPGRARHFTGLAVRPLDAAGSDALLAARGVAPERRGAIVSFAGGSPLVLSLAASAPAAHFAPTGDLLTTLVERLVGDLPGTVHRRGLDVLALARVTRESLLRAVLGDEDAATVFSWLRRQPYVEATPDGLLPHDAVRATLDADLRWRDPERHEDVRARISVACLDAVRRATDEDALLRVAEWMFLFGDQDGSHDSVIVETRLEPEDVPEVLRMAEDPAVEHWIRRQPQGFRVYRSADALLGFMAIVRLEAPSPEDLTADPVIAALWGHVEATAPLGRGEHLGVRRFAVRAGEHQRPSPLLDLISRRTMAAEMRADGRAVTSAVVQDAGPWRHHLTAAGLHEVLVVEAGGTRQHVFGRDWRRQPVEQWVQDRVRGAAPSVTPWTARSIDLLPREAFEEGVLEALRTWRTPREFATTVLLRSHLVPRGSADPVTDLRDAITDALDALRVDPAGVKAYDALTATYISASGTHRATARRLGVPYGTYRRHLALGRERLVEQLLTRQLLRPRGAAERGGADRMWSRTGASRPASAWTSSRDSGSKSRPLTTSM